MPQCLRCHTQIPGYEGQLGYIFNREPGVRVFLLCSEIGSSTGWSPGANMGFLWFLRV
jgi:hypothetical protein